MNAKQQDTKLKLRRDYHMHSTFSSDANDTPAAMCRRALALGLTEIALTEHAEWINGWRGFPEPDAYFAAVAQCQAEFAPQGLTVRSGVELGNPHEHSQGVAALLDAYPFDVKVASLHWLYGENIHLPACFAGRHPDDVYADYFAALGQMAADSDADIIAHFDRILWCGTAIGARFDLARLEDVVREALTTIAWRGQALELNTRYLAETPQWHGPLVTMLRWFRESGGQRVVVNSDAHSAAQMGLNASLALDLLLEAGFDRPARIPPAKQYLFPI